MRKRSVLARHVQELRLSGFQALYQNASLEREELVNLVASLVMACPNLERLTGFNIPFQHTFDRLSHALSTRTNLKERVWLLGESDTRAQNEDDGQLEAYYHAACDPTEGFIDLNSRNPVVSSLMLHQELGQPSSALNFRAILGTVQKFPALRSLSLSGLAPSSLSNLALSALPSTLQSLRLEDLPGINDKGIERFASSPLALTIQKLTLVDMGVASLATLSNILSTRLASLKSFCIVQNKSPRHYPQDSVVPFRSLSLEYLHWEIRSQAGVSSGWFSPSMPPTPETSTFPTSNPLPIHCLATSILAASITDGNFPSLRRIRVPHDPQGVIQALCRPLLTALLPSDAPLVKALPHGPGSNLLSPMSDHCSTPSRTTFSFPSLTVPLSPRADSAMGTPTSMKFFTQEPLTPTRSRLEAQSRILAARKEVYMLFRVYDPAGNLEMEKCSAGFVGTIGSQITYDLRADWSKGPASSSSSPTQSKDQDLERSEWVTDIEEILCQKEWEGGNKEDARRICGHVKTEKVGKYRAVVDDLF